MLHKLLDELGDATDLIKSAFRGAGILPIDEEKIIRKISHEEPSLIETREHVSELVLERLKALRETDKPVQRRGKRLNVEPGKSVVPDEQIASTSGVNPPKTKKRRIKASSSSSSSFSSSDEDDVDDPAIVKAEERSQSPDSDNTAGTSIPEASIVPVTPEIELKTLEETEIPVEDALSLSEGDFVVVRFGSLSSKNPPYFVCKIIQFDEEKKQFTGDYLRKLSNTR